MKPIVTKEQFYYHIAQAPVFDAHTHLVGKRLPAGSFWEIVHYFWFLRELQGAGYPAEAEALPEEERIDAFLAAYRRTGSTAMHYAVSRIFQDLYGIALEDRASVRRAIGAVASSAVREGWALETARRGPIAGAVVNKAEDRDFQGLCGTAVYVPRVDGPLQDLARRIHSAGDRGRVAGEVRQAFIDLLRSLAADGARGIMTTLPPLERPAWQYTGGELETYSDCVIFLLHALCETALSLDLTVQFFLGIETGTYASMALPVNRFDRVLNLYGLFEAYPCRYDLVVAAECNNMDCVQAAVIFPHVHVGGMWWFNFRPSTYGEAMHRRFEALAENKSYLSISDSRCIEWCYGKNLLIKKLAADFLSKRVEEGYIDYEAAGRIGDQWLHGAAASLYGPRKA